MTPVRINLFGAPCVGKSTIAASVFSLLKQAGEKIEFVQEWVKNLVFENRPPHGWSYIHSFASQLDAERRVLESGVSIVTDSPILLQAAYAYKHQCSVSNQLTEIAAQFDREFTPINFLILRDKQAPYDTVGRWETREEAESFEARLNIFVSKHTEGYPCYILDHAATHVDSAARQIVSIYHQFIHDAK